MVEPQGNKGVPFLRERISLSWPREDAEKTPSAKQEEDSVTVPLLRPSKPSDGCQLLSQE